MGKNQDSGSGIRDKHPGSATLEERLVLTETHIIIGSLFCKIKPRDAAPL